MFSFTYTLYKVTRACILRAQQQRQRNSEAGRGGSRLVKKASRHEHCLQAYEDTRHRKGARVRRAGLCPSNSIYQNSRIKLPVAKPNREETALSPETGDTLIIDIAAWASIEAAASSCTKSKRLLRASVPARCFHFFSSFVQISSLSLLLVRRNARGKLDHDTAAHTPTHKHSAHTTPFI